MKGYQSKFLNLALEANALEFGEFTLKSGRKSPYFFNAAKMLNGIDLSIIAESYAEALKDCQTSFDCIYGPAYKGIFLSTLLGMYLNKDRKKYPISFNRKEIKNHGEGGSIIGAIPKGNVLIIDDVISAGTAIRESIENINNIGAIPKIILVGLDRQEKGLGSKSAANEIQESYGILVQSIINLDTLISFSSENKDFHKYQDELIEYRKKWGA